MSTSSDAADTASGAMESTATLPSDDFNFDTALTQFESKASQQASDDDILDDPELTDEPKAGEGEGDDNSAKTDDETATDKKTEKDEEAKKSDDDKKTDKKETETQVDNPRANKYKEYREAATEYQTIKPQLDAIGGTEGLAAAVELINNYGSLENVQTAIEQSAILTDTDKTDELISLLNELPHGGEIITKLFYDALDNEETGEQNRTIAFNDSAIRLFGLPKEAAFKPDELEQVLAYIVAKAKDDREDFFDEIQGELRRHNVTLPSTLDKQNPLYKELEAERRKNLELQAKIQTNGKQGTKEESTQGASSEIAQMDATLAGYNQVIAETVLTQTPAVLKSSVAEIHASDPPELKEAKQEFQELLDVWISVKMAKIQSGEELLSEKIFKNLPLLTNEKFKINPNVIQFKNTVSTTAKNAIKQKFDKIKPLLTIVREAAETTKDDDDPEKIITGERQGSITQGKTKPRTADDLRKSANPFDDALKNVHGK